MFNKAQVTNFESCKLLWLIKQDRSINILIYQPSGTLPLTRRAMLIGTSQPANQPANQHENRIEVSVNFFFSFLLHLIPFCLPFPLRLYRNGQSFFFQPLSFEDWLKNGTPTIFREWNQLWTFDMRSFRNFFSFSSAWCRCSSFGSLRFVFFGFGI